MTHEKSDLHVRTAKINGPSDHGNLGYVRVATAVPVLKVGDPVFNAAETVKLIPQAEAVGAKVLVFPELGMTGYTCGDLFQNRTLRHITVDAVETVVKASLDFHGIIFIGAPLEIDRKLFNCAVAISRGKILGIVPKTFLPNYNEFYEKRWFAQSPSLQATHVEILGNTVPVGVDLLFTCEQLGDLTIGVDICEDAWAPVTPGLLAALNGATLIVNLSASNELVGKAQFRRGLVSSLSSAQLCAYAYTSAGVHESTTDVVFSGAMVIAECGTILKENPRFERKSVLQYAEIDLERIVQDRLCNPTFTDCQTQFAGMRHYRDVKFSAGGKVKRPDRLVRKIDASPFVPKDKATLGERCLEIFSIQTAALAKRLDTMRGKSGKAPKVTIGVSGGLDSTLALVAAVRTYDMLGIPRSNIHGYTLPGFGTTSRTKGNAHSLMKDMGITAHEVDIRKACLAQMQEEGYKPFGIDLAGLDVDAFSAKLVEAQENAVATKTELKDLYFENVQARMRTKILMDNGFVIGTGDVSELAKGWCTYNGDHMSMYNVNCSVPKTLVKFLVEWAANAVFDGNARTTMMDIVATEISPELLPTGKDGTISQKTEDKVGPYELTDFYLYYMVRWGATPEKMFYLAQHAKFNQDYSDSELLKWLKDFLVRFFANQFKRSCVPDGPKVGSISLSPRGDWRMPSDAEVSIWLTWVDQAIASQPAPVTTNGGDAGKDAPSNNGGGDKTASAVPANGKQGNSTNMSSLKVSQATLTKLGLTQAQFDTIVARLDARQKAGLKRILRVHGRVDIMTTFTSIGSLPVAGGEEIVPGVNELSQSEHFDVQGDFQDAHGPNHGSFVTQHPGKNAYIDFVKLNGVDQQMWTVHGVDDGRTGADSSEFAAGLDRSVAHFTFKKGQDDRVDSYSGLYDNGRHAPADVKAQFPFLGKSTGFVEWLTELADAVGAEGIEITCDGLALTHCVKFTAIDARSQVYKGSQWEVQVVVDCTRPIVLPGETAEVVIAREKAEMEALGIKVVNKADVLAAAKATVSAGK